MLFYELFAIIYGTIAFIVGLLMIFKRQMMMKNFNESQYIDLEKYCYYFGLTEAIGGILFLAVGIAMFFVKVNFVWEIVLISLIVISLFLIVQINKKYKIFLEKPKAKIKK